MSGIVDHSGILGGKAAPRLCAGRARGASRCSLCASRPVMGLIVVRSVVCPPCSAQVGHRQSTAGDAAAIRAPHAPPPGRVSRRQHRSVATVRANVVRENQRGAQRKWREVAIRAGRGPYAKPAELMDDAVHEVMALIQLTKEHYSQISRANPLKRATDQITRSSLVMRTFCIDFAMVRLVIALLIKENEERIEGSCERSATGLSKPQRLLYRCK